MQVFGPAVICEAVIREAHSALFDGHQSGMPCEPMPSQRPVLYRKILNTSESLLFNFKYVPYINTVSVQLFYFHV